MVSDIDRQVHETKMEEWRYNYPFASAIMSGYTPTDKQALDLVKLGEERRNDK